MEKPARRIRVFSRATAFRRFGLAIFAAILATVLRVYLNPVLGDKSPFLFHAIAVAVSAQYGGAVPGLITTILSLVLTQVLLFFQSADTSLSKPRDIFGTLVVFCVGIFLSFFFGRRQQAEENLLR